MALALVHDLREHRTAASAEELADFETDVLAGFVLARASAGLADSTIRNDTGHLELIRDWFGRPLWEMQPGDADAYFGKVLRDARPSTRTGRAAALTVYFQFLELRHKIELHNLTGRVIECPLDEMNRPSASVSPHLRVPPTEAEVGQLFAGWREELASCRKFAPAARNYAAARLAADVGLRINEARMAFFGYNVQFAKALVFSLAGAIAGLAGGLYAFHEGFVWPNMIGVLLSTQIVLYVLFGGAGTLIGSVVGVGMIEIVSYVLADRYPTVWPVILGVLLLLVILLRPSGLVSLIVPEQERIGSFGARARRGHTVEREATDGAA